MEEAPFSCNLKAEATKHVAFLRCMHKLGISLEPVTPAQLQRYAENWLPLLEGSSSVLVPPPDVAWLWHCHRLAPKEYASYCKLRFGRVLEANPPFSFQEEGDSSDEAIATREVWSDSHPTAPFFAPDSTKLKIASTEESTDYHDLNGFDLVASSQCQAELLWQVSRPNFEDDAFLVDAVDRYAKFLTLKSKLPIVPTYQIDLMWHTHILVSSRLYDEDCVKIRGETFHHDDSFNDRTPGGNPDRAFQATKKIWKEKYGDEYSVPNAMYRGKPPAEYYSPSWISSLNQTKSIDATDATISVTQSIPNVGDTIIRWEYNDIFNEWLAYESQELQDTLEAAYESLPTKISINIGDSRCEIDFCMMEQTLQDGSDRNPSAVRRNTENAAWGEWEHFADSEWVRYSDSLQEEINVAYGNLKSHPSTGLINCELNDVSYELDVRTMLQKNLEDDQVRTIRRARVILEPWLDPRNNPSCFIRATSFNRMRANAPEGFAFGKGPLGEGYYSLRTKEAYQIIYDRVHKEELKWKGYYKNYKWRRCLCFFKLNKKEIEEREEFREQYEDIQAMAAHIRGRMAAPSPDSIPDSTVANKYLDQTTATSQKKEMVGTNHIFPTYSTPFIYDMSGVSCGDTLVTGGATGFNALGGGGGFFESMGGFGAGLGGGGGCGGGGGGCGGGGGGCGGGC